MITYYSMYFLLAYLGLNKVEKNQEEITLIPWLIIGVLFSLIIGFRFQIGGDWFNYLHHFNSIGYYTLEEVLKRSDPGYYAINWFMSDWGFEIYAVNLVCAIIFMLGLITFAKKQPNPWLAIAVSIPYLIVVVAMGYTRQAVALGLVFWSLTALEDKRFKTFLFMVVLAATFHKSAVLMIGLGLFLQGKGKLIRFLAVLAIGFGIWSAFLADYQQDLWKNYVEVQMQSQGARIRVAMNFLPSVLLLLYRKQWQRYYQDYGFWVMLALGSILSVFFVNFASTAVDRIVLYFTPIQVVVYSRLPRILESKISKQTTTMLILAYYLLVLYVWLNYASHSQYWLPYETILFDDIL